MINRILNILSANNINKFLINEVKTDRDEVYYIKSSPDQLRHAHTIKYLLTLYRDFENNKKYTGSYSMTITPSMTDEELNTQIKSAYESALYVLNPYYELVNYIDSSNNSNSYICNASSDGNSSIISISSSDSNTSIISNTSSDGNSSIISISSSDVNTSSAENGEIITIFDIKDIILSAKAADNSSFINSFEIFLSNVKKRVINSNGIDVEFTYTQINGEFIVQSTLHEDVELYESFSFDVSPKSSKASITNSLENKINRALKCVSDRSVAADSKDLKFEKLIIEGDYVKELFSYFTENCSANLIYPGYSEYKIGDKINHKLKADNSFSITMIPKYPISSEGIEMKECTIISAGTITAFTGDKRLSSYMNIEATGEYTDFILQPHSIANETPCNSISSENNLLNSNNTYLRIAYFSDFQLDSFTGQFGGEYRLAYFYDGQKEHPVTGGSISFDINELIASAVYSGKSQTGNGFKGPYSVTFTINS